MDKYVSRSIQLINMNVDLYKLICRIDTHANNVVYHLKHEKQRQNLQLKKPSKKMDFLPTQMLLKKTK